MNDTVITWEEYCEAVGLDSTVAIEEPSWFPIFQAMAMGILRKCLAQSHLLPRNHDDIDDLKDAFKDDVIKGIAWQTCFMHDNEIYYENGYVNFGEGNSTFSQSVSGQSTPILMKIFRDIFPKAYDHFDRIGWTYSSLEHPMRPDMFYKGEK